jgi:hypothetical protein
MKTVLIWSGLCVGLYVVGCLLESVPYIPQGFRAVVVVAGLIFWSEC